MVINNYDLNNQSIGIFLYFQNYLNFIKNNSENNMHTIIDKFKSSTFSPISNNIITNEVDFKFKKNIKKIYKQEVKKLEENNILFLYKNMYCINQNFIDLILNTDFNKILPISNKKLSASAQEILIALAEARELEIKKISFKDFCQSSFTSTFKNSLYANGYVKLFDYQGNEVPLQQIYKSDREIDNYLYKHKLSGYIIITEDGLNYLHNCNIYSIFNIEISNTEKKEFLQKNSLAFEIFKNFNFFIKKNINNEYKLFIEFSSLKEHFSFLKLKNKYIHYFKDINYLKLIY